MLSDLLNAGSSPERYWGEGRGTEIPGGGKSEETYIYCYTVITKMFFFWQYSDVSRVNVSLMVGEAKSQDAVRKAQRLTDTGELNQTDSSRLLVCVPV